MINDYDHLNKTDPIVLEINLDELAKKILKSNYGVHRFFSALIRQHQIDKSISKKRRPIIETIEKMLKEEFN